MSAPPTQSKRIEERFYGLTTLLERGWDAIPAKFATYCLAELKLTPSELAVVLVIYEHKWRNEDPFPSLAEIAASTGLSYGGVRKIVSSLVTRNLIQRTQRTGSLSKETSLRPLLARLCALDPIAADERIKDEQHEIERTEEEQRERRKAKRGAEAKPNDEAQQDRAVAAVINLQTRRN